MKIPFGNTIFLLTKRPWFQGALLMVCVAIAMLLANLPFTREGYHNILNLNLQIHLFDTNGAVDVLFPRAMTVEKFINDILMTVFFFAMGLEIRREMSDGELSSRKKAIMPLIAAFGGVVLPAIIYTAINNGTSASSGWGIPTATDIAFAVCILSMLSNKVPVSLKIFLIALAIADDLIAILVVAIFYGEEINLTLLGCSLAAVLLIRMLNKRRVSSAAPYLVGALVVWILIYYSGIHATMSGVLMAFLIPSGPVGNGSETFSGRVEHIITPWVNYAIMPVFALANAGVTISDVSYFNVFAQTIGGQPEYGMVGLGIFLGLVLGKPLGITLFSWTAIRTKIGDMPQDASWPMFFAVACLGGIGFTMSIFVDTLSFGNVTDPDIVARMRDAGKIAVLLGSICSAILGSALIGVISSVKKNQ